MILNDWDIIRSVNYGKLGIVPFDERCVQPASYDVHLHEDILCLSGMPYVVDLRNVDTDKLYLPYRIPDEGYAIEPDECILGRTVESFSFPKDISGRFEGVSTLGRLFLMVHVTAGFFDPGFCGTATLEIKNIGPNSLLLRPGMRVGQMSFWQTTGPARNPYGSRNHYQNQVDPTPPVSRGD